MKEEAGMALYPELSGYSLRELVDAFQGSPPDGMEYAYVYYSEVAQQLATDTTGTRYLLQAAGHADADHLRAIIFGLTFVLAQKDHQPEADDYLRLQQLLLSCLSHPEPMIVAEAVDSFTCLKDVSTSEQVMRLSKHASPYVRGGVLRYEARLFPDRAIPTLLDALHDPHYIVREGAADELADLDAPDVISHLTPLLSDPHPHVAQAARSAIEALGHLR
jgi:hypothetical protein